MADRVRVWFDAEADYLEVRFSDAAGYMKETKNDALMERVDAQGRVIGFSVMSVSRFKKISRLRRILLPLETPALGKSRKHRNPNHAFCELSAETVALAVIPNTYPRTRKVARSNRESVAAL